MQDSVYPWFQAFTVGLSTYPPRIRAIRCSSYCLGQLFLLELNVITNHFQLFIDYLCMNYIIKIDPDDQVGRKAQER